MCCNGRGSERYIINIPSERYNIIDLDFSRGEVIQEGRK